MDKVKNQNTLTKFPNFNTKVMYYTIEMGAMYVYVHVATIELSLNVIIRDNDNMMRLFEPGAWMYFIIASVCKCLYACVCVSAPKAINN